MKLLLSRPLCLLFLIAAITFQISAQGIEREIIWSDYPYPLAEEHKNKVQFGHIVVPETRNSDNPRTLKIAFCHIKGNSEKGILNPIIMLPGGPGGSMTQAANGILTPEHWKERLKFADVILFDPRGCGKSEPELCPALDDSEVYFSILLGLSKKDRDEIFFKTLKKCVDSLKQKEVDLNAYGSDEIAEDIEDLRVTLGVNQWNILGGSYGTRYGQGLIRKFPNTVRSAVFGGLVPTVRKYEDDVLKDFSNSLQLVLKKCKEDPACNKAYPDLKEKLFSSLEYFDKNPLVIRANEQKLIKGKDIFINDEVIINGLIILLYGPAGIEVIPKFIQACYERNIWAMKNFVNSIGDTFRDNQDMLFFIYVNDNPEYGLSPEVGRYNEFTKKLMPYFVTTDMKSRKEYAELVGIRIDTTQELPIESEIPVILSTGLYDHVTPPENSVITSKYLTNSIVLTFPESGHWKKGNTCYSDVLTSFYKTAELPDNAEECLDNEIPLEFVTGISDNKGVTHIGSKIYMGDEFDVYIPLGISLLLIFIGFIGLPINALIRFLSRRKNRELKNEPFGWITWIMTVLVLVFVGLFYVAIMASFERNLYILGFGILSEWNWIFWIFALIVILSIYIVINNKKILKNTSKTSNILSKISWLGTFVFVVLLIYWNVVWPFS